MKLLPVALLFISSTAFADAPIKLKLTLKSASDTRSYDLALVEKACGKSEEKVAAHTDSIKVCAHEIDQNNVRLDVDWLSRHQAGENTGNTSVVVAKGATAMVSSTSAFRLDVSVQ
jgi:hypothetical protein